MEKVPHLRVIPKEEVSTLHKNVDGHGEPQTQGPTSMEKNWLEVQLEKWLEIPFLILLHMSKRPIFERFLSEGNLKPKLEPISFLY